MNTKLSIREIIELYLSERDFSDTTLVTYRKILPYFFHYLSAHHIDQRQPKTADIISWKRDLKRKGLSTCTIDLYLVSLKGLFRWLKENNIYDNIVGSVRIETRHTDIKKEVLTPDQVKIMLSLITDQSIVGIRDKAMINLMYTQGLRCCEVSRLNISDIDPQNNLLKIQGKGHNDKAAVAIMPHTIDIIGQYIQARSDAGEDIQPNTPAFISHWTGHYLPSRLPSPSIGQIIKNRMKSIGITMKGLSAHSLRHSAAVSLLDDGNATLYDVSIFLRHSSIETTRHYTRFIERRKSRQNHPQSVLQKGIL